MLIAFASDGEVERRQHEWQDQNGEHYMSGEHGVIDTAPGAFALEGCMHALYEPFVQKVEE